MIYTFIMTYRGGTYIDQVEAPTVWDATRLWAEKVANDPDIEHLDAEAFRHEVENELEEFPPTPIDGCPNVWHLFFFSGRNRMDVHIVNTMTMMEPAAVGGGTVLLANL
jgi:hypothetical protein